MRTATSLYAAIENPERVRALIMVRPPTAGKERAARRQNLLSKLSKISLSNLYSSLIPVKDAHIILASK